MQMQNKAGYFSLESASRSVVLFCFFTTLIPCEQFIAAVLGIKPKIWLTVVCKGGAHRKALRLTVPFSLGFDYASVTTSSAHCFIQIEQCKINYNGASYLFWYQDMIAWSVSKRRTVIPDISSWFIPKICLAKYSVSDKHLSHRTEYKNWKCIMWYFSHHMHLVTNNLKASWAIHTFISSCWDTSEIPPWKSICSCYPLC